MTVQEYRTLLSSLPFMFEMPESLRQQVNEILLDISELRQIEKGTTLFAEGDTESAEGYVLLSGSVQVTKSYAAGCQAFAPVLLGEVKQFNPRAERTASVQTLEDSDALFFTWDRFQEEARKRLDEHDQEVLRKALLEYAWLHLLN